MSKNTDEDIYAARAAVKRGIPATFVPWRVTMISELPTEALRPGNRQGSEIVKTKYLCYVLFDIELRLG